MELRSAVSVSTLVVTSCEGPRQVLGVPSAPVSVIGSVFSSWADAVGPQVAAHARPVRLAERRLVEETSEADVERDLSFKGLAGLADPLRPGARDAISLNTEKQGSMVGRVQSKGPDAFEFSLAGAPKEAKPLEFRRQK